MLDVFLKDGNIFFANIIIKVVMHSYECKNVYHLQVVLLEFISKLKKVAVITKKHSFNIEQILYLFIVTFKIWDGYANW